MVAIGAAARTVVNGNLCRGSCAASAGGCGATRSATTTRAGRPCTLAAERRTCDARCCGSVCANNDPSFSAFARRDGR
jgi:hypothetical protein